MDEQAENWREFFASLPVDTEVRQGHQQELESRVLNAFDTTLSQDALGPHQQLASSGVVARRFLQSKVLKLAIAASLLIGVAFVFSIGDRPVFALEKLVDKIVNANTARWDMILQRDGSDDHQITVSLTPNGYRLESVLQIMVVNWDKGKSLSLFPQSKEAVVASAPRRAIANTQIDEFRKIRDGLRDAMRDPEQNVESLGEGEFESQTLSGFRFHSKERLIDVWADPKTQFPKRIELSIAGGQKAILLNYQTDFEPDESLLNTNVPDGYRLLPGEDDLIATLRISCELSGGVFPPELSTEGIGELSVQFLSKRTGTHRTTKEQRSEVVEELLEFQRGFAFLISLVSDRNSDVYYAGNAVKLNEVDRPILWYKPNDSEHYRVIDASLTVTEQADAPEAPGATKL